MILSPIQILNMIKMDSFNMKLNGNKFLYMYL